MNAIQVIRLGIDILTARLLTLLALGMTFALACWVMVEPTLMRACMAGFFALFVFIPCAFKERTKPNEEDKG